MPQYLKPLTFENLERIFMLDIRPRLVRDRKVLVKQAVLSKMTVVRDYQGNAVAMNQFQEVEFLEVFARIVDYNTRGTPSENIFLHKKIEGPLD